MLFVAYWEDPLLVLTNVTDEDGYVSVRTITPDYEEVSEIQVAARGRAELDNADPTIRGFLEVKAYVTDIRSVLEHDRPGKGLTREYGLPCWDRSDIPGYGRWGVLEMRDWWSTAGPKLERLITFSAKPRFVMTALEGSRAVFFLWRFCARQKKSAPPS